MQKIGQLFLLRTNINSVGSVLDSPVRHINSERRINTKHFLSFSILSMLGYFPIPIHRKSSGQVTLLTPIGGKLTPCQTYPDLQPLYDAARSYLEIPQRINLLNTRVEVCFSFFPS